MTGRHLKMLAPKLLVALQIAMFVCCAGCQMFRSGAPAFYSLGTTEGVQTLIPRTMPRELAKTALPDYVIEPPDILLIDVMNAIPLPPYRIHTLDTLIVNVVGALPEHPIDGVHVVESGGVVNLGAPYGSVKVSGLTVEAATKAIDERLRQFLKDPIVSVFQGDSVGKQMIAGEHIVGPDGKVSLGTYGKVFVAGMTQENARMAIEKHLSNFLENPEVSVEVYAYNSKFYYVITQGAGLGDAVRKFPVTGNETVLDALVEINGLEAVSSKSIWVSRPSDNADCECFVLPVDWEAIAKCGSAATNYQLMPGDRVFIAEDPLVATDTFVSKIISPFERVFGFVSLGTQTVSGLHFFHLGPRGNTGSNVPGP